MAELDPLLDALARAGVPDALGAIEPQVMHRIALHREASAQRRTLSAVAIAALGLGAVGASLPYRGIAPHAEMSLAAPLALAPSNLLAVDL
jgi:hypothetical protein